MPSCSGTRGGIPVTCRECSRPVRRRSLLQRSARQAPGAQAAALPGLLAASRSTTDSWRLHGDYPSIIFSQFKGRAPPGVGGQHFRITTAKFDASVGGQQPQLLRQGLARPAQHHRQRFVRHRHARAQLRRQRGVAARQHAARHAGAGAGRTQRCVFHEAVFRSRMRPASSAATARAKSVRAISASNSGCGNSSTPHADGGGVAARGWPSVSEISIPATPLERAAKAPVQATWLSLPIT